MAEKGIVESIQRLLTQRGHWWVNVHGAGVGRNGIPDILACVDGRFLALEVKQFGNNATPLQRFEIERIRRAGGHAFVVHSRAEAQAVLECCQAAA